MEAQQLDLLRRPSASRRGYDRAWRAFRADVLHGRPYCEDCLNEHKRFRASRELHHIVALKFGGSRLDERNVRALCRSCHARRTAAGE